MWAIGKKTTSYTHVFVDKTACNMELDNQLKKVK